MKVPFVDLVKQYRNIKAEIDAAIQDVIDHAAFTGGERVEAFEHAFAEKHGAKYCIGTSSGTDALHLILWSMGLGPGDKVIVPVNTFAATAEAAALTGAKPVFVDCDDDYNIASRWVKIMAGIDCDETFAYCDAPFDYGGFEEWEKSIYAKLEDGSRVKTTKAIIPVHLYGQPANMKTIMEIAQEYNLQVIEDCCQAHNASYQGKKVGSFGIAGAFSFYPSKNLGAFGEGGAVITNDEALYKEMRLRQNHGQFKKGYHDVIGHNYRLEGIQAAVLNVKLQYLDDWTEQRRQAAKQYFAALADIPEVALPQVNNWNEHVFHLFVVRVPRRGELRNYLHGQGIDTGIHYPIPLHLQKAFAYLGHKTFAYPGHKKGDFPVAEKYADEILSLPMYPELTKEQIEYVAQHIWTFYRI